MQLSLEEIRNCTALCGWLRKLPPQPIRCKIKVNRTWSLTFSRASVHLNNLYRKRCLGFLVSSRSRLSNGIGPGEVLGAWMDIFSQYYVTNSLGPMTNDKKRVDESSEIKKEPRVKRDYSSLTRHRWCFPRALIFIVFFSFVRWWDAVKLTIFEKLRLLPCFPCAVTEQ